MGRDYVIIADSTNDFPATFAEENHVDIVHLLYEIGGETYGRERDLTPKELCYSVGRCVLRV